MCFCVCLCVWVCMCVCAHTHTHADDTCEKSRHRKGTVRAFEHVALYIPTFTRKCICICLYMHAHGNTLMLYSEKQNADCVMTERSHLLEPSLYRTWNSSLTRSAGKLHVHLDRVPANPSPCTLVQSVQRESELSKAHCFH